MVKVIEMNDVEFIGHECDRETGDIHIRCNTKVAYDAIMELLNDGKVLHNGNVLELEHVVEKVEPKELKQIGLFEMKTEGDGDERFKQVK